MEWSAIRKLQNLLLVTVPGSLTDSQVLGLRRRVLRGIRQHRSRWVLLDFSEVEICDSFFGRFVQGIAEMSRLMGASVVVCGLQDAVIETLIEMGFDLPQIHAVLDVDEALELSRDALARDEDAALVLADDDEPESLAPPRLEEASSLHE